MLIYIVIIPEQQQKHFALPLQNILLFITHVCDYWQCINSNSINAR